VSTISEWLASLGMSEYAERFAENRIDLSVLPDLADQHLKDLGIALGLCQSRFQFHMIHNREPILPA